jgi:fumarylpyruvate hydrolase
VKQVIEQPGERWGRDHTDAGRLEAVRDTGGRELRATLDAIRLAATGAGEELSQWSAAAMATEAVSRNPRWGNKPARFIVDHLLVEHVRKHTGQIRRNVTQFQETERTVNEFLFTPPPAPGLPIRGRSERFPIRRIFCVGRNYEAHAREMGHVADREAPFYFTKAACHYLPSGSTVPYPPGTTSYHHEMELVAAIGKPGFRISAGDALGHVFGYACGLDMTRRDLQSAAKEKQRPWDLGKDVENSAVAGEVMPVSEGGHPERGRIELRVNGQTKQSADLSQMIHGVTAVIVHLSQYYHLQPGDLIFTGTPEGVGAVKAGDLIEGSIEGVGTISLQLGQPE